MQEDKNQELKQKARSPHTIIVQTALKKFTLIYNINQVTIKGYMMDLSLKRKKCNTHIIDRFNQDIKNMIKANKKILQNTWKGKKSIEILEVQVEGQSYFVNGRSPTGLQFLSLPKEITRMKWEEKFNCEKKKIKLNPTLGFAGGMKHLFL